MYPTEISKKSPPWEGDIPHTLPVGVQYTYLTINTTTEKVPGPHQIIYLWSLIGARVDVNLNLIHCNAQQALFSTQISKKCLPIGVQYIYIINNLNGSSPPPPTPCTATIHFKL